MYGKKRINRRQTIRKQIIAVIMATVLLCSVSPFRFSASAADGGSIAVIAPGGTVSSTSTTIDVAMMFDNTATSDNDVNVTVTKAGSVFTVTLKNDLTLDGTVNIDSGVKLTVLSAGDYTITRGANCTTHLFSTTGGQLELGSGTISNNNITYHLNDGSTVTYPVGGTIPTSTPTLYVTSTEVLASIESTMIGTLTIDGGASGSLADYSGTAYSHPTSGNTSNNKNLIKCTSGSVTMWDGVTLGNNLFAGNDSFGGGAVNLNNGIMYMYGGTIRRCVNVCSSGNEASSLGDGGAMFLHGSTARLYMYGGTITQCESDNSGAISLWQGASLYLMGGSISHNFAVGDNKFPAQAISAYDSAKMYIYDGEIKNNDGVNDVADMRISTVGSNDLHFFGGNVGRIIANDNAGNMLYVYAGSAASIIPSGHAQLIRYTGTMKSVMLENAVQGDGAQISRVTIYNGGIIMGAYNMRGSGTAELYNSSILLDLSVGVHRVEIESVSMKKTYNITVSDTDYSMTSSVIMTTPVLSTKTVNTITLLDAGTGNSVDGTMYYGYSTSAVTRPAEWQLSTTLTGLDDIGFYYCYVKVISVEHPDGYVCETPLEVPIASIQIPENILLSPGGTGYAVPITNPVYSPLTGIVWGIENAQPDTTIKGANNSSGRVTLSLNETINTDIIITADLFGRTAQAKLLVAASCSHPTAETSSPTVVAGDELSWSMTGYTGCTYRWQELVGTTWNNIEGKTTDTYATENVDISKIIRLSVTYGGESYYSPAVTVNTNDPTFIVIIPESITPLSTFDSFEITGIRYSFTLTQSIIITCSGDFTMAMTSRPSITLGYTLYRDVGCILPVAKDGTGNIATLSGSGSTIVPVYYKIDTPLYAGTYTDTLTFTVSFNSGS